MVHDCNRETLIMWLSDHTQKSVLSEKQKSIADTIFDS